MPTVTIAEFKSHLSEFMGLVSFKKETILVTRHGRVIARVSPPEESSRQLSRLRGWLDDRDPFFTGLSRIVKARAKHVPRVMK